MQNDFASQRLQPQCTIEHKLFTAKVVYTGSTVYCVMSNISTIQEFTSRYLGAYWNDTLLEILQINYPISKKLKMYYLTIYNVLL